jgi:hypothetical protein
VKGFLSALALCLLGSAAYGNPLTPPVPAQCSNPSGCNDIVGLVQQMNTTLPAETVIWSPGAETAIVTAIAGYTKIMNPVTVTAMTASSHTYTCTTGPTVTLYNCGTSATCAAPTTIASVQITAAGTAFPAASITNPSVAAGNYIAWATSAGSCTVVDVQGTMTAQ